MGSGGRTRGTRRAESRPLRRRSRRLNPDLTPSPRGSSPDESERDNDNEDSNTNENDDGNEDEADPDSEPETPYAIIHVPIRIRRRQRATRTSQFRLWARRQGQGMRRLPPPLVYGLSVTGGMALGWTAARIRGSIYFLSGIGVGLVVGSLVHGPRRFNSRRREGASDDDFGRFRLPYAEDDDDDTPDYQTQWQTIRVWGVE